MFITVLKTSLVCRVKLTDLNPETIRGILDSEVKLTHYEQYFKKCT